MSKLSQSALLVSKGLLFLSYDPVRGTLVPKRASELLQAFISDIVAMPHYGKHMRGRLYRALVHTLVRLAYPGMILNYALRKQVIEGAAQGCLKQGCTQVVVIGAGLDTLSARLQQDYPDVTFVEVDKEETQSVKRQLLQKNLGKHRVHFISADLSKQKLEDLLLAAPAFNKTKPTMFILEGVSMYLRLEDMTALLMQIQSLSAPGSTFAFTFMDARGRDRLISKLWQKKNDNMNGFAMTPEDIAPFLERFGMKVAGLYRFHEMQKNYVSPREYRVLQQTRGEHVCIANRF